jgi:hypothetical protein
MWKCGDVIMWRSVSTQAEDKYYQARPVIMKLQTGIQFL